MRDQPILQVTALRAGYGKIEVLKSISLEVYRGEIVTMIGANGAGKTSTLNCISRVLPLKSGSITFHGQEITTCQAHELVSRGMAHVPEGRKIFGRLTVRENLELGAFCRSKRTPLKDDFDRVFDLFPVLSERSAQLAGTLSGGEQQMLAIGRALMSHPRLLLMDEPSMGIAPILVEKIFTTIKRLNEIERVTILLVEQNAHSALSIAQRAYVLETGEITLSGEGQVLLHDSRVREAYLGEDLAH